MRLAISKQYQTYLKQTQIGLEKLFPRLDHNLLTQTGIVELSMKEFYQMVQRLRGHSSICPLSSPGLSKLSAGRRRCSRCNSAGHFSFRD